VISSPVAMTRAQDALVEKNLDLIFEFERYVLEHPSSVKQIPKDAVIALQVKGDETYNRWSRRQAERQAKTESRPVVQITINKLGPVRSRIQALEIERAS
jgi:uncharacterized protein DUF5647